MHTSQVVHEAGAYSDFHFVESFRICCSFAVRLSPVQPACSKHNSLQIRPIPGEKFMETVCNSDGFCYVSFSHLALAHFRKLSSHTQYW